MSEVTIVGLVSAYKEGRLVRGAIESLQRVGLNHLYVYEGPAGAPLDGDVPPSDYSSIMQQTRGRHTFHAARWRSDARKRDEMLQRAKREHPGPLWGVVLDGDEVLVNAEYLRDLIQATAWDDEANNAGVGSLYSNPPTARIPLRLIERDGGVSIITARVIRLDLIRSYDISSSVITNTAGVREGWGNRLELSPLWVEGWAAAMERGQIVCLPPFPCEPCIVHRAHLRHPLRRGLRMQDQETELFAQARREGMT